MKKIKNKNEKKITRVILPFAIIIIIIFLITILLSKGNINRFLVHLGIAPQVGIMAVQQEFTYTIPASQLSSGKVVGYYSFANDTSGNRNFTNSTPGAVSFFIVIYPEDIHHQHIEDMSGNTISSVSSGQSFRIVANVSNNRTSSVTRTYIVQLVDPDGKVTQPINSNIMSVGTGTEEKNLVGPYLAQKPGIYTAQVFVWSNMASAGGFPIASPESSPLTSS